MTLVNNHAEITKSQYDKYYYFNHCIKSSLTRDFYTEIKELGQIL